MSFLEDLAARRRFGMKPGLDAIRAVSAALGNPQERLAAVHVAGTNGKGAVCALLEAALRRLPHARVARYTSPHLVRLNERFFLDGAPVADGVLEAASARVAAAASACRLGDLTFFEALTAVAFAVFADARADWSVLECGLGGRLDATNVCRPRLSVITRVGLDHCDWLGDTVARIAAEKAGIVKPGVPVVLGLNEPSVRDVVATRAKTVGAPFHYAPDLADASELPDGFALPGSFNRENGVTALAALKVLFPDSWRGLAAGFAGAVWPGRYQRVGAFLVDGAHNPPAARALADALAADGVAPHSLDLIAGFCGDKDADAVLAALAPFVRRAFAVRTTNPRSLSAEETAAKMRAAGLDARDCPSPGAAIASVRAPSVAGGPSALVCGSLFLAGEALSLLGAPPWGLEAPSVPAPAESLLAEARLK